MALRQSVKITYAHKRARTQANNHITSSPLEPLASDHDDITRSEMSRRMLKRSRRAAYPEFDDGDIIERKRVSERLRKKPKKSEALCQVSDPNAMTTSDLLPPDALTFQTPFPSSDYINPLNITRPLIPEQLSPVPLSRSRLSRTSSRNLKENGRRSRFLESPFHSRPGSAAPSPQNKGRPRKNQNASLHTKSRTLSRGFEENRSKRSSRPDSYASCHNSTKNSPNKLSMHQRRPSNPTPSYMLEHITQQEWMIPPKALIRPSAARVTPPYLSPIPTQNSFFLSDHPQFYSTPLQCRASSRTGLVPPDDSPIYKPLAEVMDHPNLDERFDVEMDDVTEPHARQTIHIHGNSIISSSGEFTLGPTATTEFVGIESPNGSDTHLSGVSPVHEPTERYPLRRLARVAVGDYNIRLASMTCSPSPGSATQNLCQVAPRVACKKEAKNVQKVFVGVVPLNLPHAATSPSLMDADIASDFCYDSQSRAPKSLTPNTPPQSPVRDIGPSSPANSLIQEMQSLGLRESDCVANSDEGVLRSIAEKIPLTTFLAGRARSLDSPADITAKKAQNKTHAAPVRRSRAGTIRASDYMRPAATITTVPGVVGARRTRSGTVVGPNSSLAAKVVVGQASVSEHPMEESEDDLLLLKGPFRDEDLEYLGLGQSLVSGREQASELSEDELLLKTAWRTSDWPTPERPSLKKLKHTVSS